VRRVLKYAAYALAICLTVILMLPIGISTYRDVAQRIEVARFYSERPVLNTMKAVVGDAWVSSSEPARHVLLQHVPLGTDRVGAVAALSKEDFHCRPTAWPDDQRRLQAEGLVPVEAKGPPVDCELLAPTPVRPWLWVWSIHLWFGDDGRLLGAKVGSTRPSGELGDATPRRRHSREGASAP
jgi:hypothetical protein